MADELEDEVREATRELIASKPDGLVWADLTEMGWFELVDESPALAVGALFEGLGQAAAGSEALDAAVLIELTAAGAELSLDTPPAVVYYPPGRHAVGSLSVNGADGAPGAHGLDGIVLSRAEHPSAFLAPLSREDGSTTLAVLDAGEVTLEPISGVDPSLRLRRARAASARVIDDLGPEHAARLARAARRAVAHESIGLARAILDVAVEHVTSRKQFGRAIGTYQAVQHRLTDIEVALGGAAAVTALSWEGEPDSVTVLTAKSLAAAALDTAVRNGLQVCGGMGFTEEFPLAPLVRRALFLSSFLGGAPQLAAAVGRTIVAGGSAPRLSGFAA
ncbi:acyl-CoA dehydrogenase family protein [Agromyces aerolatus]|uniref:acyl-CoA dehydrogenase family protein n=1 Tax=Agromyces sp. LY-1074 TaxID=3074080 RepID=UPI002863BC9C|nr:MULTISPECIES: acyl-CoA dehydrogenase family protein [unclassified Agromyces]MDR5699143.1 acyl-CoA dehydrogenase family protein [Agromyces sp. LY-1074]MDR5705078.1 acyl-CoA dehydrogenase family protein [Agromyces sp. LY-1358]